jgi:hypothetical protein
MSKISKSPDRHSFQKEGYVKRQLERGEELNEDYLEWFNKIRKEHDHKFDDPESRKNNLEYDLLTTDWILEKVRAKDYYAQNLYAAMCNRDFQKLDVLPILKDQKWSCSWRYAGGIIADMQQKGDYIDWYCSGIRNDGYQDDLDTVTPEQYVSEGFVTEEIEKDLNKLGWVVLPESEDY